MASTKTIFFSVGEPSGDLHGANLIAAIRSREPAVRCVGYGGPNMQAAGCELHADLTRFAVMWVAQVISKLPVFLRLLREADQFFRQHRPDAVVLIDYPGFNWWIARRAKRHGIPVYYYGAPQLWAWAGWRVGKLRRLTDFVLCKLPFEEIWLRQRGCNAVYVGHPYFDELAHRRLDSKFLAAIRINDSRLLTLLPGSRDQEVEKNLPLLLKAANKIQHRVSKSEPDAASIRVVVASFNDSQASAARGMIAATGTNATVCVGRTPELIELATCCLACSGSVSLELMYHKKPAVVVYAVNRIAWFLQHWLRTARYISLVNLLASKRISRRPMEPSDAFGQNVPFPEFLAYRDTSTEIADEVVDLLENPGRYQSVVAQLSDLNRKFGRPGTSERVAEFLLDKLHETPRHEDALLTEVTPGPHRKPIRRKNPAMRDQESRFPVE